MLPGVLEFLGIGSKLFEAQKEVKRLEDELRKIRDVFRVKHVDATLVYSSHKAVQVDSIAIVRIPTDKYVQVAPGVWDRALTGPDDIKFDFEEPYKDSIATMDFDLYHVLFCKFSEGGNFSKHYHLTDEIIKYLKGIVVADLGNKTYKAGETQFIPAMVVHIFHPVTSGYCLIGLKKAV